MARQSGYDRHITIFSPEAARFVDCSIRQHNDSMSGPVAPSGVCAAQLIVTASGLFTSIYCNGFR